ncbi:MAG: hypothetical protein AAFW73_08925 [Bacteroidota bacterium]
MDIIIPRITEQHHPMNATLRSFLLLLCVGLLGSLLYWNWPAPPASEPAADPLAKWHEKSQPNDFFTLRHAYPDDRPDVAAYRRALEKTGARLSTQSRSRRRATGMDSPWLQRGPGDAGARVNTLIIHPNDDDTMLAGFSGGGIFKTTDGGANWNPVFDDQPYLAIGDLHYDPNRPDTIYAGTGDPNITSYPFIGNGLYRSVDGGDSWTNIGLADEGIISKVIVDPTNSDIIYVSTMGLPFARSTRRGVYKSTDGGLNWDQILQLGDSTGVIDLLLNPDNPQVLYAAGWDRIRNNSESIVSGNGAKIYRTTNGGTDWSELGNGLPTGPQSRIGLAMAGNNSDLLFALYVGLDFNVQGVYRSTNGGDTWTALTTGTSSGLASNALGGFGWYFGQLAVDPNNSSNLYIGGVQLWASTSGGTGWFMLSQLPNASLVPHVDHHAMAWNSAGDIIIGTDGGLYRKPAGVNDWIDIDNIPATQFYRVAYNPFLPDNYYGGTQDNGTLRGNRNDAIDWDRIFSGDGFQAAFNPEDSLNQFVETQNGVIWASTNGGSSFQWGSSGIDSDDPRAWDMQYILSPHNPDILYTATNRLYISTSGGIPNWSPISLNLTIPNPPTAPRYHVVTTLSESPIDSALIYVGTSDAQVRRRNPDNQWSDITPGLPNRYVTDVVASPDSADVVFVSHSGYRDGELLSHVHRSDDRGANWQDISGNLPNLGVNDLLIMPEYGGQVIFAATDGGVYATLNGGTNWQRLGGGFPLVPVYDLVHNIEHNELVAGTHARSIYAFPLDSIGIGNQNAPRSIAGTIRNEAGQAVNAVDLLNTSVSTGSDGTYAYTALGTTACSVEPSKNNSPRLGLSVSDLVLLQRHLLFLDTLDSPYKIIAADVNASDGVSVTDLLLMQRMLIFLDSEWNNSNSWRFIPSDFAFSNPLRPFDDNFPETYDCNGAGDRNDLDFVALKLGDVNGTASTNAQSESSDRLSGVARLILEDRTLRAGEQASVPLLLSGEGAIYGLQAVFEYDAKALEILAVEPGGNGDGVWKTNTAEPGWLHLLWMEVEEGRAGFPADMGRILLRAKRDLDLSEVLQLSRSHHQEAVWGTHNATRAASLDLAYRGTTVATTPVTSSGDWRIFPNPVRDYLQIRWWTDYAGLGQWSLYDTQGRLVASQQLAFAAGENTHRLDRQAGWAAGLYWLRWDGPRGEQRVSRVLLE